MSGVVQVVYDQRPRLSEALGTLATTLRSQSQYRDAQARDQQDRADAQQTMQQKQADEAAKLQASGFSSLLKTKPYATTEERQAAVKVLAASHPDAVKYIDPALLEQNEQNKLEAAQQSARRESFTSAYEDIKRERSGGPPARAESWHVYDEAYKAGQIPETMLFDNVGGSASPQGQPTQSSTTQPARLAAAPSAPSAAPTAPHAPSSTNAPPPPTGLFQVEKSDTPNGSEAIYYPPGRVPDQSLRLPGAQQPSATVPPLDSGGDPIVAPPLSSTTPSTGTAATIRGAGLGTGVGVPPSLVTAESMIGDQKPSDQNRGPGSVPSGAFPNAPPARPWNDAQTAIARQTLKIDPTGNEQVTAAGGAETRKETARKNRVDEGRLATTAASENALRYAQTAEAKQKTADAKNATSAFTGAIQGAAVLGGANLSDASPIIRAAIERRYDPALMRRWKPEQQAAFEAEVQKYDPNFSMAEYPKQLAVKRSFTSGPDSNTVKSINQLVGHLDTLVSTFDQIDNTRIPAYNAAGNFLGSQLGNTRIQQAKGSISQAVNAVANEAAKTFHGSGVPAEKEIQEFRSSIGPNTTPAEFKGATQTLMHLLGTAIDQMQTKYKQGVGVQEDFQIIQPRTAKILTKLEKGGVDTSGASPAVAPPTATQQPAAPQIGDRKTFPNGKIGVWNGHGWVAQP